MEDLKDMSKNLSKETVVHEDIDQNIKSTSENKEDSHKKSMISSSDQNEFNISDEFTYQKSELSDICKNKIFDKLREKYLSKEEVNYTFDGVFFESIEKIGAFHMITNLKTEIKQGNKEKAVE